MKDDRLYIQHVLDCIERIDRYCQNEEDFRKSDLIQDAVLRNLQTLAEATQRIGDRLISVHLPVLAEQMKAIWHEADSPG